MRRNLIAAFLLAGVFSSLGDPAIPLAGEWRFALDRGDVGVAGNWYTGNLPDKIKLPGILQAQGYGDEITTNTPWVLSLYDKHWSLRADYTNCAPPGAVKVPFLCQPPRHYLGAAWYQRDIDIPTNWSGKRVVLFLERPHWESRVWVDDRLVGTNNSLCTPHEFELGVDLAPGHHRLTVRVDNRMILPYRPDAHSVSDSLGQSWNGIVGRMELRSTPMIWIESLGVYPHVATNSVTVKGVMGNVTGMSYTNWLFFQGVSAEGTNLIWAGAVQVVGTNRETTFEVELRGSDALQAWDEFHPRLYRLFVYKNGTADACSNNQEIIDREWNQKEIMFGLREFKAVGSNFAINGRKTYLRGTHNGGDFPLTGYPPTDVEYWRKLFATCKEWGLNHMRFHSFCPPEAAFTAADEAGIYLQIEPGMWNPFNPDSPMAAMLDAETARILKAYGNHPSFVLFSPSNEPKGKWREVLPQWAEHWRAVDPRRLYTSATGFTDADAPGPLRQVDYTVTSRFGRQQVRGVAGWFGGDYARSVTNVPVPVIAHELGQWCAYPDFDVMRKYTGYLQPGSFEIFRESAAAHGVLERNHEFARASGEFQVQCYKEEIEANLRTPGLAGFQLLDLHDYTGQGTALVGLLDPFWEPKGYVTADRFREFCGPIVPLVRLLRRVFTTADHFEVPVEVAAYGESPFKALATWDALVKWDVLDTRGRSVARGELTTSTMASGKNTPLGTITTDLSKLPAPAAYKLVVRITPKVNPAKALPVQNSWNFWLYPAPVPTNQPADVLVTSSWDKASTNLMRGGKVLFLPRAADLNWSSPPLDPLPVFWNRLMNPQWSRMLGLWCDTRHPALAGFPTAENCDWQWTELLTGARAMNLEKLPRGLQPIVSAIDDWNRNWKLGVLFEAKVGAGRLVVCTLDLRHDLESRPVARQLRRSVLDYMAAKKFQPLTEVSLADFNGLRFDSRVMRRLGATVRADGSSPGEAIDGDPNTCWLVGAAGRGRNAAPPAPLPHTLTVTFTNAVAMDGLVLMNRQNDRDHVGDIREFEVQSSEDGTNWVSAAQGELASTWSPQTVRFGRTVTARQLRFVALSGFGKDTASALAELSVIYAGPKLPENGDEVTDLKHVRSTSRDVDEGMPAKNGK